MLDVFRTFDFSSLLQIIVLAFAFYYVFLFFRGTRGAQVLIGLVMIILFMLGLTMLFRLDVLAWILRNFIFSMALALLIIFQPEIRRALAELGKQPVFSGTSDRKSLIDNLVQAVAFLNDHKVGALIAIEQEIGTRGIQETGVTLDCPVIPELLSSIFIPHTPLHDGGVIISHNRIMAAGCVFPLTQRSDLLKTQGTRHRAAIGLSEETDAVVIVVSEETGAISVAYRGRLSHPLTGERLGRFLSSLLLRGKKSESTLKRVQEQLDLTPEGIAKSENLSPKETAPREQA